jgi:hypothetical protein
VKRRDNKKIIKTDYPGCFQSTQSSKCGSCICCRVRNEIKSHSSEKKKFEKRSIASTTTIGYKFNDSYCVQTFCELPLAKKVIIQINCVLDITLNINIQFSKSCTNSPPINCYIAMPYNNISAMMMRKIVCVCVLLT